MAKKKQPPGADGAAPDPEFLRSVGGKRISLGKGGGEVWNFGWIPPENRTQTQEAAHAAAVGGMPRFAVDGKSAYADADRVNLYEIWKHPDVVQALGFPWTGTHQFTGSCVWAGGQNVVTTMHFIDVIKRQEAERLYVPFGLLAYGRSRFYLGDRSPGEGSTGSTFAKAAREDGFLDARADGMPPFRNADGIEWGGNTEMSWSDGDASQTMNLLPESRKRLVKSTAQLRSADDVREAIKNEFPVTCASMYAHDGGKVQGSPACLLARRQGTWSHQMSVQAWWLHPQFGELYWLQNQWGLNAHGKDPAGGPPGGVWITKADMDWICRDEVFAFSQYDGFPAPAKPIPWLF